MLGAVNATASLKALFGVRRGMLDLDKAVEAYESAIDKSHVLRHWVWMYLPVIYNPKENSPEALNLVLSLINKQKFELLKELLEQGFPFFHAFPEWESLLVKCQASKLDPKLLRGIAALLIEPHIRIGKPEKWRAEWSDRLSKMQKAQSLLYNLMADVVRGLSSASYNSPTSEQIFQSIKDANRRDFEEKPKFQITSDPTPRAEGTITDQMLIDFIDDWSNTPEGQTTFRLLHIITKVPLNERVFPADQSITCLISVDQESICKYTYLFRNQVVKIKHHPYYKFFKEFMQESRLLNVLNSVEFRTTVVDTWGAQSYRECDHCESYLIYDSVPKLLSPKIVINSDPSPLLNFIYFVLDFSTDENGVVHHKYLPIDNKQIKYLICRLMNFVQDLAIAYVQRAMGNISRLGPSLNYILQKLTELHKTYYLVCMQDFRPKIIKSFLAYIPRQMRVCELQALNAEFIEELDNGNALDSKIHELFSAKEKIRPV